MQWGEVLVENKQKFWKDFVSSTETKAAKRFSGFGLVWVGLGCLFSGNEIPPWNYLNKTLLRGTQFNTNWGQVNQKLLAWLCRLSISLRPVLRHQMVTTKGWSWGLQQWNQWWRSPLFSLRKAWCSGSNSGQREGFVTTIYVYFIHIYNFVSDVLCVLMCTCATSAYFCSVSCVPTII